MAALETAMVRARGIALAARSAERLARSRDLLKTWRRHHPRIAGAADEPSVRDRVRAALRDGTLTRIGGMRSWAGYGSDRSCHVCGELIRRRDIEHEIIETGSPIVLHAACLRIWREESGTAASAREIARPRPTLVKLLLAAPTCAECLAARLGAAPADVDSALAAIARIVRVTRPAPEACAVCGSDTDVVAVGGSSEADPGMDLDRVPSLS